VSEKRSPPYQRSAGPRRFGFTSRAGANQQEYADGASARMRPAALVHAMPRSGLHGLFHGHVPAGAGRWRKEVCWRLCSRARCASGTLVQWTDDFGNQARADFMLTRPVPQPGRGPAQPCVPLSDGLQLVELVAASGGVAIVWLCAWARFSASPLYCCTRTAQRRALLRSCSSLSASAFCVSQRASRVLPRPDPELLQPGC